MRRVRRSSVVAGIFLFLCTGVVHGLPVSDLYTAEVLVPGEGARQLKQGARAGLLQVLVRVSGNRDVGESSLIESSLRNPDAYYYQYSFDSTHRTLLVDGETVPARLLNIRFEPSAVARLLRSAGFPVWGSNRPGILVWLAVSDGDGRRMLSENDTSGLVESLQDQARLRGLPLLFPLLDLEDSAALSTAEVWGAFLGRITDASVRYSPDAIMTGRVQKDTTGRWTANWSYRIDNEWSVAETVAFDAGDLVRAMVDRLADELAHIYAIDASRGQLTLRVESVETLEDYAAVSQYIESLATVLDTFVVSVEGSEVEFRLKIEGNTTQLTELIELDRQMVLVGGGGSGDALRYRWLGRTGT